MQFNILAILKWLLDAGATGQAVLADIQALDDAATSDARLDALSKLALDLKPIVGTFPWPAATSTIPVNTQAILGHPGIGGNGKIIHAIITNLPTIISLITEVLPLFLGGAAPKAVLTINGAQPFSVPQTLPMTMRPAGRPGLPFRGCLGRLPKDESTQVLAMKKYAPNLPAPLAAVTNSAKVAQPWGMMLNDNEGDCTIAAIGHAIQTWTANNGNEQTVADADVQTAYVAVTGAEGAAYDPTTGANDNGCQMTDVLPYMQNTGLGGHKIGPWVAVDHTNHNELMLAIQWFGGIYIGVGLPLASQTQTIWTVPNKIRFPRLKHQWQPGSWGGHAIFVVDYDATYLTCVTWGALQKMSWAWFDAYCDEAYGIVSPDWVTNVTKAPNELDLPTLLADQQLIKAA